MRKLLFLNTFMRTGTGTLLLLWLIAVPVRAATADARVEQLKTLKAQIDSLELEKQVKKRSGQELTDLEEQTALLRDSIQALRSELEKRSPSGPFSIEQAVNKSFLPQTIGLFDWILIAGAGLVILLAILFILFYRLGASRREKTARQARLPVKKWEPQDSADKPRDTAIQRAYAPQMKNGPQAKTAAADAGHAQPKAPPPVPPRPAARPAPVTADLPKDQADLVVRAAASGFDIKEISRRYHISEDQVALILKMSKKQ